MPLVDRFREPSFLVGSVVGEWGELASWGALGTVVTILAVAGGNDSLREALRRMLMTIVLRPWTWLVLVVAVMLTYEARRDRSAPPISSAPIPGASTQGNSGQLEPVPRASGADWPVERGSNLRHGRVGESAGPRRRQVARVWRSGRADEAFYGSPAVVGDTVYAIGSEAKQARVVAVDLKSGELRWSGGPTGYRPTFAAPVVVGTTLFAAEGLHSTKQARVFALDLRPRREGALRWSVTTASHVECTPCVQANRLWFNAGDDGAYGYELQEATSNSNSDSAAPKRMFHRDGRELPDAETCLLIAGDRCFVGLGVGGNALVQLDARTGDELRRVATPHPVFAPLALRGELLFLGMGAGDYTNPEAAKAGAVWCVRADTLDVVWKRDLPGTVLGAVVVDDTQVVVGCGDGRVVALDHAGQIVSTWDSGAPLAASLALTPDFIYGINRAGTLFAIDRRAGEIAWKVAVGRPGHYMSGPVIVGERLVFGTPNDGLVCFGP